MNVRILLSAIGLLSLGGCILVAPPRHSAKRVVVVKERDCRPNEYWDGDRCVHKGKGHGKGRHKHDD
jgi:hypothetical protein